MAWLLPALIPVGPLFAAATATLASAGPQAGTRISVQDLLRFNTIGDPGTLDWLEQAGEPTLPSPDGRRTLIVVRGGDPQRESNDARILLFDTSGNRRLPTPVELVHFSATGTTQPIAWVRWLNDSRTVVFAGSRDEEIPKVFSVDTRTLALTQLTHDAKPLSWYGVDGTGKRLVTLYVRGILPPDEDPRCRLYGCLVPEHLPIWEAEAGGQNRFTSGSIYDAGADSPRALVQPEDTDSTLNFCDSEMAGGISPDGRYAVRYCRLHSRFVPRWWGDYTMSMNFRNCIDSGNPRCWRRGFLLDLDNNTAIPWTAAPQAHITLVKPIWIDGGRQIILPAAFEPLEGVEMHERARRASRYVVQLLDPAKGQTELIARLPGTFAGIQAASWDARSETLRIEGIDADYSALPAVYYKRRGAAWSQIPAPQKSPIAGSQIVLRVHESLTQRPVVSAVDPATGKESEIYDPNPWLSHRNAGRMELIRWATRSGRTWEGVLYYPPDFERGRRYPLVMQTHGFDARRYSLAGISRNFPGAALAAQGMYVLQLAESVVAEDQTPLYWEASRAGLEAAIDHLSDLGLIDRERVGTIGWSDTGNSTSYLFTHSDYPIAAAAFTSSAAEGWLLFMKDGGSRTTSPRFGTQPFGAGLIPWLEQSPTFNIERVRSPFLILADAGLLGGWDWFVGLQSLGKPVEFWRFPTGAHDVVQASQRLRMSQLLVDWFRYWLQAEQRTEAYVHRDDTPETLAQQYVRWGRLRAQQQEVLRSPRPPLLKWSATPRK